MLCLKHKLTYFTFIDERIYCHLLEKKGTKLILKVISYRNFFIV